MSETKQCTLCGEIRPIEEFSWHSRARGYRQTRCRSCRNALEDERRANPGHRDRVNARRNERYATDPEFREGVKARTRKDICGDCGEPCEGGRCRKCHIVWMRSLEGRQHHSEAMNRPGVKARISGESHHGWRGGDSDYGPEWTAALKKFIRDRDGHACRVCGVPEDGRAHDVHHKDYDMRNNASSNLVTLCHPCHSRTGGDRIYWQAYLTGVGYELYLGAC